jgi:hypothetical protein
MFISAVSRSFETKIEGCNNAPVRFTKSVCLSVRPSACNELSIAELVFIKLDTGELYKNLSTRSNFGEDGTTIKDTLFFWPRK